jgi:NAD(P)-dependent dehydrogenase (short-subunit alcohol dehydrogenase family)
MTTESPRHIVLVGASGGIGRALLAALLERFPRAELHATRFRAPPPFEHPRVRWRRIDIRDDGAIADWASGFEQVDWLLNCAGFLHGEAGRPEKSIHALEPEFLIENLRVNSLPTLLLARHFDTCFKRSQAPKLAAVSARVGSIEDNRLGGWYSYRMSKAALNMGLRTLSIEWRHRHPRGCVAALHPGTNDTALSKPYQANVAPGQLFDPACTAASFVGLLERLEPASSGNFWTWDGERLPW